MTSIKNTDEKYGWMAVTFHWVIAGLIFFQLGLGLYMSDFPNNLAKLKLFGLHKEFGFLILFLVLLRLLWRSINQIPALPAQMPIWQKKAALWVHIGLYICLILMPISGWLISSAADLPISFFGLFTIPTLIPASESLESLFSLSHTVIAYLLMFLIVLHIAAALHHHFIVKDNILRRMLY